MINFTALEEIDKNANKILKRSLIISIVISIVLLSVALFTTTHGSTDIVDQLFGYFLLWIFLFSLPFAIVYHFLGETIKKKEYQQFALDNGFTFYEKPRDTLRHAHFLHYGDKRKFSYCIEAQNYTVPFSFFRFEYGETYKTGDNKTKITWHPFIIAAFELRKEIPNIYIHNIKNDYIREPFTEEQRLALNVNSDYEKNHVTYAPKEYEIEALQILDSTFVDLLSKTVNTYDVEFFNTTMFIYGERKQNEYGGYDEVGETKKLFEIYDALSPSLTQKMSTFSFAHIGDVSTLLKKDGYSFFNDDAKVFAFIFSKNGISLIIVLIVLAISAFSKFILPLINN